jgi:hypothetical protein
MHQAQTAIRMEFCPVKFTDLSHPLSRLMSRFARLSDRSMSRFVSLDCPDYGPLSGMAMAQTDDILDAIDRAAAMGARSPVSRWMRENHDAFAARLAVRRANWIALAGLFEKAGLTDGDGKTITAETARKTWLRVRQHMARVRASTPTSSGEPVNTAGPSRQSAVTTVDLAGQPGPSLPPERPLPAVESNPPVVAPDPPARPRNTFAIARFKRSIEES